MLSEIVESLHVLPLGEVLKHEETIAHRTEEIRKSILRIGMVRHPLIVDKGSGVILDGNHRLDVAKLLELKGVPCQVLEYFAKDIKIGSWLPVMEKHSARKLLSAAERVEMEQGFELLKNGKAYFLLALGEEGYVFNSSSKKIDDIIEQQLALVHSLDEMEFSYVADFEAEDMLEDGKCVLFRRSLTKAEVVRLARAGKLLPPKSTRHVIPNRLICLDMKVEFLRGSLEEANSKIFEIVRHRYLGNRIRRYPDSIIVLND